MIGELMVEMNTRGTGQTYRHRWVDVPKAAKKVHTGWYYLFSHACNSEDYEEEVQGGHAMSVPPDMRTKSVQSEWMFQECMSYSKAS